MRLVTLHSARGGTRTLTPLREPDFESGASTNSTTRAGVQCKDTGLLSVLAEGIEV